jgi:hypothetical protein
MHRRRTRRWVAWLAALAVSAALAATAAVAAADEVNPHTTELRKLEKPVEVDSPVAQLSENEWT